MGKWTDRRVRAVRARVEASGLRVVCLLCSWSGRYFRVPGTPAALRVIRRGEGFVQGPRLRETECPRCQRKALRMISWVERFPDLARVAADTHRAIERVLS